MALGMVISFVFLLTVGLFSFEVNRLDMAKQQLRSATDAAALAAAATLASSDNLDPVEAHTQAINTALNTFQQNSVIGLPLTNAYLSGSASENPLAEQSSLFIEFLDPHRNNQAVPLGDPTGKIVRISSAYGITPSFGQLLGLSTLPVRSVGSGGVPTLDVVLCFDVSASIDDQTPVTFVKRQWNGTRNVYTVVPTRAGSPAGPLAQGKIYDIIGPPPTGSAVDGVAPQTLSASNDTSSNRWPLTFSEENGATGARVGLRGATESGSPPGTCPNTNTYTYTYSDLVVNIDGRDTFAGIVSNGYNFPDLATLVEAARGNLENNNVFVNSRANTAVPGNIQPRVGYQAEYQRLAKLNSHPLVDAQQAAQAFLSIMNTNTDAHFSMVAFTSNAGTASNSTLTMWNVDSNYRTAGQQNFPVPLIALNPGTFNTNYETCSTALSNTTAISGTNIGDAVYRAVLQLNQNRRPGSKRAIVLFTDGQPTSGNPLHSDPWTNARRAAQQARTAGIPIYAIGLAQNPEIIPSETAILNDTNANVNTGGMVAIAGNGGKFFLVTRVDDLRYTFENIARQLVQLVK